MIILGLSSCFIGITSSPWQGITNHPQEWKSCSTTYSWQTVMTLWIEKHFMLLHLQLVNFPSPDLSKLFRTFQCGLRTTKILEHLLDLVRSRCHPPRVKIVFYNLFLTNCYGSLNWKTLHVASVTVGEFSFTWLIQVVTNFQNFQIAMFSKEWAIYFISAVFWPKIAKKSQ